MSVCCCRNSGPISLYTNSSSTLSPLPHSSSSLAAVGWASATVVVTLSKTTEEEEGRSLTCVLQDGATKAFMLATDAAIATMMVDDAPFIVKVGVPYLFMAMNDKPFHCEREAATCYVRC